MFLDPHSPAVSPPLQHHPKYWMQLLNADCLEVLAATPAENVDLAILDLPFACTRAEWDREIDPVRLWTELRRVLTPTGTVVAFGVQPFLTRLTVPAMDLLKYTLVWEKTKSTLFQHVRNRPLPAHEDIFVYSKGAVIHASQSDRRMTYNLPADQRTERRRYSVHPSKIYKPTQGRVGEEYDAVVDAPRSVLRFAKEGQLHPSQKPVSLLKWLVHAFSNPDDLILDPTMGSGSTGVAALELGRDFIGIERDTTYFEVASDRLRQFV